MEGLDEVLANIAALGNPKATKKAATKAARKAMNVVRKQVATNAKAIDDPNSPTKVWKNVKTKAKKSRNKEEIIMQVGLKGGAKKPEGNVPDSTWYWRFVELGTSNMPAQPFLRVALYNNAREVEQIFISSFNEEIMKEINR